MKVSWQELPKFLKKSSSACYLLAGSEPYQKLTCLELLWQQAQQTGYHERCRFELKDLASLEQWSMQLQNFSLFSSQIYYELHLETNLDQKAYKTLVEAVELALPHHRLVFQIDSYSAKTRQSALFQMLDEKGVHIPILEPRLDELPRFIALALSRSGYLVDPESLEQLSYVLEGNLLALGQIIEHLQLAEAPKQLNRAILTEFLVTEAQLTPFALTEALFHQDRQRLYQILNSLESGASEPNLTLWVLVKELRIYIAGFSALFANQSLESALKTYKIWPNQVPFYRRNLKNASLEKLYDCLVQAQRLDLAFKGGASVILPWQGLRHLATRIVEAF